jgi:hypothetical protein
MGDRLDEASESQDILDGYAIEAVRRHAGRSLLFTGYCYYCYEGVHSPHIFCGVECRDDWEHEKRLTAISGIKW